MNRARWTGAGDEPRRTYPDDAGFDLTYRPAVWDRLVTIRPGECADIPCQVSIQWPPGIWGLIIGRSSTFRSRGLMVNPGIIDPGFRGPLFAVTRNIGTTDQVIHPGDRIAQVIPMLGFDYITMQRVDLLDPSDRGENGFGSSGR